MAITLEYNIKVNDGAAVASLEDIEKELSKINDELKTVDVNSDAFADLSAKSKILKKDLDKVTKSIDGMTAEDKIKGFQGAIDIAGGSVAALTGAVGLLGIENEEFEKYTAYAANALAFSQGLKQMGDGAVSLAESLGKSAKAQALFDKVSKMTNTTMGKFKIALAATGIGAIVIALGLLIANFDKVSKFVVGLTEKFPALGAAVNFIKIKFDSFIAAIRPALEWLGLLPDEAERAEIAAAALASTLAKSAGDDLKRAQAAGASAEEIYKLKQDLLSKELEDLKLNGAEKDAIAEKELQIELTKIAENKRLRDVDLANKKEAAEKARVAAKEAADKKATDEKELAEKEKEAAADLAALRKEIRDAEVNTEAERRANELLLIEENYQKLIDLATENNLETDELEETRRQLLLEKQKEFDDADVALAQTKADELKAISDKEISDALAAKEAQVAIENAKWGLLAQAASVAQQIAGDNEAVAIGAVIATQAAAIGQIVASTGLANAKALAASPLTFGQPWIGINTISAGLSIASAVASGAKSIKDIKSSGNGGGGGGGGSQLPSGGRRGATPSIPSQPEIPLGQAPEGNVNNQMVKAYVVAGDVTSTQEANAKINTKRTLG
jgi:hypothetical protein